MYNPTLFLLAATASLLPAAVSATQAANPLLCPSTEADFKAGKCFSTNLNMLAPNDPNIPTNNICNNGNVGGAANWNNVNDAWTSYIKSRPTAPGLACVGPKSCGVKASSGNAVIAMCNDNTYGKCLAAQDLANRMTYTFGNCAGSDPKDSDFNGQTFYSDGTNIIIKHN